MSTLFARHRWWVTRLAALPVHLVAFSVVVFFLVRLVPGDPVIMLTGGQVTDESYRRATEVLGLNGSLWEQFLSYLGNVLTLDLGDSLMTGRPVWGEVRERFPATLELALLGLLAAGATALAAAYLVVLHPGNPLSKAIRGYGRAAGAIPEYCVGVASIFLFYYVLHWAPAPLGRVDAMLSLPPVVTGAPLLDALIDGDPAVIGSIVAHLVLPVTVMVLAQSALLIKLLVAGLEEAVDAAPTRFRIASGASRVAIVLSMYRRAAPPVVTVYGSMFGYMLGGVVILESLFGFGGMGQYAVDAVNSTDMVPMQGFLLIVAAASLTVFFLVDIANMLIDPRRRPGVRAEVEP